LISVCQPACWGMRRSCQDGLRGLQFQVLLLPVNKFGEGASCPTTQSLQPHREEWSEVEWSGWLSSACLRWFFSVAADEIIIRGIYNSFHLAGLADGRPKQKQRQQERCQPGYCLAEILMFFMGGDMIYVCNISNQLKIGLSKSFLKMFIFNLLQYLKSFDKIVFLYYKL